jgi:hypothetical protein
LAVRCSRLAGSEVPEVTVTVFRVAVVGVNVWRESY